MRGFRPLVGFLTASLVFCLLSPAAAQQKKWEVGLGPGYAFPTHHAGDYMKKSFDMQLSATYQFHEWLAGGAELGMATGHPLGGKINEVDWDNPPDGHADGLRFESKAKAYWLNFSPLLKIGKWIEFEEINYRPYAAFGFGLYQVWYRPGISKLDGYTTAGAHVSERPVAQNSDATLNVGVNLGLGVDQQVFESFIVGFDIRFHHVFGVVDYDRDGDNDDDFDFLIPGLRFYYFF